MPPLLECLPPDYAMPRSYLRASTFHAEGHVCHAPRDAATYACASAATRRVLMMRLIERSRAARERARELISPRPCRADDAAHSDMRAHAQPMMLCRRAATLITIRYDGARRDTPAAMSGAARYVACSVRVICEHVIIPLFCAAIISINAECHAHAFMPLRHLIAASLAMPIFPSSAILPHAICEIFDDAAAALFDCFAASLTL